MEDDEALVGKKSYFKKLTKNIPTEWAKKQGLDSCSWSSRHKAREYMYVRVYLILHVYRMVRSNEGSERGEKRGNSIVLYSYSVRWWTRVAPWFFPPLIGRWLVAGARPFTGNPTAQAFINVLYKTISTPPRNLPWVLINSLSLSFLSHSRVLSPIISAMSCSGSCATSRAVSFPTTQSSRRLFSFVFTQQNPFYLFPATSIQ